MVITSINRWHWEQLSDDLRERIMRRSQADIAAIAPQVAEIIALVRRKGDVALRELTARFDGVSLNGRPLRVHPDEFRAAEAEIGTEVREALRYAIGNVRAVHRHQAPTPSANWEEHPGLRIGERIVPIPSVGLYVPRGRGSFPSMLYMLAIPAAIARVPRICIVTPPMPSGEVDPACLYAATLCGVEEVYRVGGAQSIAALTYGSESIAPVAKVIGPGSIWVTAAKRAVSHRIETGLSAGPSESMIVADDSADPWRTALDLAIEAEHGSDSAALLVTPDAGLADRVAEFLPRLIEAAPEPRGGYLRAVFRGYGGIMECRDLPAAIDIVNRYAPEHLLIRTRNPEAVMEQIDHAGEILIGEEAAFSLANYAAGANATLPTGGAARITSAVSVRDFQKRMAIVRISEEGYRTMRPHVIALADYEGFHSHAEALRRRTGRYWT